MTRFLLAVWLAVSAAGTELNQSRAEEPPGWAISNVTRWLWFVRRWHLEYPELDPAWVLGVIAQESGGNPDAEASDSWGSVGLMQIGPRSWLGTRSRLLDPGNNVRVGMRILSQTLEKTGDIRTTLALYNCGETGVENDACGEQGGFAYADRILNYWVPIFRAELVVIAGETEYAEIKEWLAELGYLYGTGRWDIEPIFEKCFVTRYGNRLCMN